MINQWTFIGCVRNLRKQFGFTQVAHTANIFFEMADVSMRGLWEAIKIECGDWSAKIAPQIGGNIIALTYCGRHILRPLLSCEELRTDPFRHGCPILLPANRTENAEFTYNGKRYRLPGNVNDQHMNLHGQIQQQRFEVCAMTPSETTIVLRASHEVYTHCFRLKVTYRLTDAGCEAKYVLTNLDREPMPYTFGLHTTFADVRTFKVPVSGKMQRDDRMLPTGMILPLSGVEKAYPTGAPNVGKISGYYLSSGSRAEINEAIAFDVSDNFNRWTLFNAGRTDLMCIEPQRGSVNGLNMDASHYCTLLPGQSEIFQWKITSIHGKATNQGDLE